MQIPETKGERVAKGPEIQSTAYTHPINMWKVNIGIAENLNFVQIGDYWSD